MPNTLASIFFRMNHGDILVRAESIIKATTPILASLEPWPSCIPNLAQLRDIAQRFRELHDAAETGNFVKVAERNALRPELNQVLTNMGDFMVIAARNDPTLLMRTCFDVRPAKKASVATRTTQLLAPGSFSVKHGTEPGTLIAKASRVPRAKSYEIHISFGDPTVEANWGHYCISGNCTKALRDCQPGKNISLRARAIGSEGASPWSHYVTIMPT